MIFFANDIFLQLAHVVLAIISFIQLFGAKNVKFATICEICQLANSFSISLTQDILPFDDVHHYKT